VPDSLDDTADVGPDGLQRLWMPHRMAYIKGEGKPADGAPECPFCAVPKMSDEDGLIVSRGTTVYAVLNLYPYNSGHLMVVPYRHIADYTDLTADETGLQHRHEHGRRRRRRHRRPSAPAHSPPLGRRRQLHASSSPHQGAPAASRRYPAAARRFLAGLSPTEQRAAVSGGCPQPSQHREP
jgi:hypothetical protein